MDISKLVSVIRYMRYNSTKFQLRFIHAKDKRDIMLYLYERWLIYTNREYFEFPYLVTLDENGFLRMTAEISIEDEDIIYDEITHDFFNPDRLPSDGLDHHEISQIDFLFDKYGKMDYDSLLEEMFSPIGNFISPETINFLDLPYIIEKGLFDRTIKGII